MSSLWWEALSLPHLKYARRASAGSFALPWYLAVHKSQARLPCLVYCYHPALTLLRLVVQRPSRRHSICGLSEPRRRPAGHQAL